MIGLFIVFTVMFLFTYFVFGAHKTKKGVLVEEPKPFDAKQKKGLALTLIFIVLIVLPSVINSFLPNPACAWLVKKLDIRLLSLVFGLIALGLRLGDYRDVFQNRIPWGLLVMLGGMCTLMNTAGSMGVVQYLGDWLANNVPVAVLPAAFALLGGLLSFITNGLTLWPLFTGMVPAMAAATGLNPIYLCAVAMCGSFPSGFSPISTGGAMACIGADDETRTKIFWRQMGVAAFGVVFNVLFALIGGYRLIAGFFI